MCWQSVDNAELLVVTIAEWGVVMTDDNYVNSLNIIKGKTIAIVYIFENEDAPGFEHYHIWKSDVITGWLTAVQELECVPYILDVRTFVSKAINNTLPKIDFVLNLNCGSVELSSMSLVPSMCSFLSLPCIPCNAASIVTGENKVISNLLATAMNLNVPKNLNRSESNGLYKPLNLGSSIGLVNGPIVHNEVGVYQEFISGYELTIPMVYNPYKKDLDLLPPILYIPKSCDPNWVYGLKEKESTNEFELAPIHNVDRSVEQRVVEFAKVFPIQTFARLDARIKCKETSLSVNQANECLVLDDLYFIEINSMPTVEKHLAFEFDYALDAVINNKEHSFYRCVSMYRNHIQKPSANGFLLSCSMLALYRQM